MGNIKQVNIKNRTYYFFNDMINIKCSDSKLLKIDRKSQKSVDIYYIGYISMKSISLNPLYHSAKPVYFTVGKVDGFIEESKENKYLVSASTDKNKEVLGKYTEL